MPSPSWGRAPVVAAGAHRLTLQRSAHQAPAFAACNAVGQRSRGPARKQRSAARRNASAVAAMRQVSKYGRSSGTQTSRPDEPFGAGAASEAIEALGAAEKPGAGRSLQAADAPLETSLSWGPFMGADPEGVTTAIAPRSLDRELAETRAPIGPFQWVAAELPGDFHGARRSLAPQRNAWSGAYRRPASGPLRLLAMSNSEAFPRQLGTQPVQRPILVDYSMASDLWKHIFR